MTQNVNELRAVVEAAKSEVVEAKAAVYASYEAWAVAQSAYLREFVVNQGRLTAIDQAGHTKSIRSDVAALKSEVDRIAERAQQSLRDQLLGLDDDHRFKSAYSAHSLVTSMLDALLSEFVEAMVAAGYDGGDHWTDQWGFYDPDHGGRTPQPNIDVPEARQFESDRTEYLRSERRRDGLVKQLVEAEARDIWGD